MKKRTFQTLQDWMVARGVNARELADMAKIDRNHMVKILTRSRRCSIEKALRLHAATNREVPVENLLRWMIGDQPSTSEHSVKSGGRKWA